MSGHSNLEQVSLANHSYFFNVDVVLFGNMVGEFVWRLIEYVSVHAAGYDGAGGEHVGRFYECKAHTLQIGGHGGRGVVDIVVIVGVANDDMVA